MQNRCLDKYGSTQKSKLGVNIFVCSPVLGWPCIKPHLQLTLNFPNHPSFAFFTQDSLEIFVDCNNFINTSHDTFHVS